MRWSRALAAPLLTNSLPPPAQKSSGSEVKGQRAAEALAARASAIRISATTAGGGGVAKKPSTAAQLAQEIAELNQSAGR